MQRLGLASLLASKSCRERELVLAMVAARIVAPHTKREHIPASAIPYPCSTARNGSWPMTAIGASSAAIQFYSLAS